MVPFRAEENQSEPMGNSSCCNSGDAVEPEWQKNATYHNGVRVIDNRGKVQEEKWTGGGSGAPKSRRSQIEKKHSLRIYSGTVSY